MPIRACARALSIALFLLASSHAFAACTAQPIFLPLHYRVGADAANCQYNDIQSAINAVGECPTVIDITREHLYTHQALDIDNKPHLTLQGWGDGVLCANIPNALSFPPYAPPDAVNPLVSLDGSGSSRVLTITGSSNVTLRNLTILNGSVDANLAGGGIAFSGQGALTLTRSTVSFNNAGFGAGINVFGIDLDGSGAPATLTLASDTLVISNTASTSGGGIRMGGTSRLFALQPKTLIGYNHAPNGYGGGIEVLGPARADIGSPGYNGLGVIYDNDAQYGGGIDVLTFDDGADAAVRLFSTDSHNPVQVSNNVATHTGGAIYLRPLFDFDFSIAAASLCAFDFRFENNIAQEGSAIYADSSFSTGDGLGSDIGLNARASGNQNCATPESMAALGAVSCATGTPCNRFAGNIAEDSSGQPTPGSTILMQSGGSLTADRFEARGNVGAHVVRMLGDDDGSTMRLTDCLIVQNTLTQEVVAVTDGSEGFLLFDSCTFAANSVGAPYVFQAPGGVYILNSIIDQPGRYAVNPAADSVAYVLSNDTTSLTGTLGIVNGAPTFIDATHGDFHLRPNSQGIDFAPTETPDRAHGLDLDRKERVVDLPAANVHGPMDLGAYEVPLHAIFPCATDDTIFCNGFEAGT